jgi:hypothetical protein
MLTRGQQFHDGADLHDKARKCRELAATALTEEGRSILAELAEHYEHEASAPAGPVDKRTFADV